MTEVRKSRLGEHVSAAVPRLWAALKARGWSQGTLARELSTNSSVVNRWLHGDQKPSRPFAKAIEDLVGLDQSLWDTPLRRPFVLEPTEAKSA